MRVFKNHPEVFNFNLPVHRRCWYLRAYEWISFQSRPTPLPESSFWKTRTLLHHFLRSSPLLQSLIESGKIPPLQPLPITDCQHTITDHSHRPAPTSRPPTPICKMTIPALQSSTFPAIFPSGLNIRIDYEFGLILLSPITFSFISQTACLLILHPPGWALV